MSKKRPITKLNQKALNQIVHEGLLSLLFVRSFLASHFKRDELLRQRIERFVGDYKRFAKECDSYETEYAILGSRVIAPTEGWLVG